MKPVAHPLDPNDVGNDGTRPRRRVVSAAVRRWVLGGRDGFKVRDWSKGFLGRVLLRLSEAARMRVSLLPLISRPRRSTSVLMSPTGSLPILIGDGQIDFTCWRCGFAICEGMRTVVEVSGAVFRCPDCSAFNRSRQ